MNPAPLPDPAPDDDGQLSPAAKRWALILLFILLFPWGILFPASGPADADDPASPRALRERGLAACFSAADDAALEGHERSAFLQKCQDRLDELLRDSVR